MLTEKKALEECIKMWDWLADNPGSYKEDYLDNVRNVRYRRSNGTLNPSYPIHACYACQYAVQKEYGKKVRHVLLDSYVCRHCPVWHQSSTDDDFMCLHEKSPFTMWDEPHDYCPEDADEQFVLKFIAIAAGKVADMARRKLAALPSEPTP